MQHLGGAETVDDVDTEAVAPTSRDTGRQRLAGRETRGAGEFGGCGRSRAGEKRSIERRHREHHRDGIPAKQFGDRIRRRPARHQHRECPDRERQGHRIAEAVGEKQLRDREDEIGLGQTDHPIAVEIGRQPRTGMDMHRGFGFSGRTGRVEPEADVVSGRGCGHVRSGCRRQQVFEAGMALAWGAGNDEVPQVGSLFEHPGETRQQFFRDDRHSCAAIGEHEAVVGIGQKRAHRHGNGTRLDRAEEGRRPIDRVREAEQHALFGGDAERRHDTGEP